MTKPATSEAEAPLHGGNFLSAAAPRRPAAIIMIIAFSFVASSIALFVTR